MQGVIIDGGGESLDKIAVERRGSEVVFRFYGGSRAFRSGPVLTGMPLAAAWRFRDWLEDSRGAGSPASLELPCKPFPFLALWRVLPDGNFAQSIVATAKSEDGAAFVDITMSHAEIAALASYLGAARHEADGREIPSFGL